MRGQQGADAGGGVAVGEEETNRVAGAELELVGVHPDLARAGEVEAGGNAFQAAAGRVLFHAEPQRAVPWLHPQVEQEGHQPVAGRGIVVERQDAPHAGGIVWAGRKIGAQEQPIARPHQGGQAGQQHRRLEIREQAEASEQPRGAGNGVFLHHGRQIAGGGQVADQGKAVGGGYHSQGPLAGHEDHRGADVRWRVEHGLA